MDGLFFMSDKDRIKKLEKMIASDLQVPVEKLEGAVSYDENSDKVTITFVLPKSIVDELNAGD